MSIGGHQSARMGNDEWLTPPEIIKALGTFDLDPCSPINRPWDTAKHHLTVLDDGLKHEWHGRVWCNPPYGNKAVKWLQKLAAHQNGTALIFARTETSAFFSEVWEKAESLLFIKGRLHFHYVDGSRANANAGAPSVLIAYDESNAEALEQSGIKGQHIYLNSNIFIIGIHRCPETWRLIVGKAVTELGGSAICQEVYQAVEKIAPQRIRKNKNYKAKVRQVLQTFFERIETGTYQQTKLSF